MCYIADYTGGAVVIQDASSLYILNSTFRDNTARLYGSVISAIFSYVTLEGMVAENNACTSEGGVLQVIFTALVVRNSRFIGNSAAKGGVFAILTNSSCTSYSTTYIDNKVRCTL